MTTLFGLLGEWEESFRDEFGPFSDELARVKNPKDRCLTNVAYLLIHDNIAFARIILKNLPNDEYSSVQQWLQFVLGMRESYLIFPVLNGKQCYSLEDSVVFISAAYTLVRRARIQFDSGKDPWLCASVARHYLECLSTYLTYYDAELAALACAVERINDEFALPSQNEDLAKSGHPEVNDLVLSEVRP